MHEPGLPPFRHFFSNITPIEDNEKTGIKERYIISSVNPALIWFTMRENDIVAAIMRLLRKTPYCFAWKEHGGMYGTAGIPDIIACIHGRFVAFEVKTENGKWTKLQEITIQKIRNAKGQAFKVTAAAEVAAILKELEVAPYE